MAEKTIESKFEVYLREMEQKREREVIYLNIYHVSAANEFLEMLGFGVYHTSVGLYDLEFSFGGHDQDSSGIVVVPKGNSAGLRLKESIPVAFTFYSSDEVDEIVEWFGDFWHGNDYDPFLKNCNHFTQTLIRHFSDKERFYYPRYVNRFTKLGSLFRMWFKPL